MENRRTSSALAKVVVAGAENASPRVYQTKGRRRTLLVKRQNAPFLPNPIYSSFLLHFKLFNISGA